MKALTDEVLVARIIKGETAAFEEIVSRYTVKAYSLARRLVKREEDAEEVLQDVFVTVFRKIDSFAGKSSFSSWLYRITVNAAFMKLRKNRQERSISMEDILPELQQTSLFRGAQKDEGDHATERGKICTVVEQAIHTLPEEYRPVFILRDIDGLTSKEVSKILDISIPAVKSRLHRSRLMIRRKLSSFYHEYTSGEGTSVRAVENG